MTNRELEEYITAIIDEECDKMDALHEIGVDDSSDYHILSGRVSMAAEIRRKLRGEKDG